MRSQTHLDTDSTLELSVYWGDTMLERISAGGAKVVRLTEGPTCLEPKELGREASLSVFAPRRGLPTSEFPIATACGGWGSAYQINIASSFTGFILHASGAQESLEALLTSGRGIEARELPDTYSYRLGSDETLHLHHAGLVLQLRYARKETLLVPPLLQRLDYSWVNAVTLAMLTHMLALTFLLAERAEPFRLGVPHGPYAEAELEAADFVPSVIASRPASGEYRPRPEGEVGQRGRPDPSAGARGVTRVKPRPEDVQIVVDAFTDLFADRTGHVGTVFGDGALSEELTNALGGIQGDQSSATAGLLGLGLRGPGPGAGGLTMQAVGLGALGTAGRERNEDAVRSGPPGIIAKSDRPIEVVVGNPIIRGALDKELIRAVIDRYKAQIRYCYERELAQDPGLHGKLGLTWVIDPSGFVSDVRIAENSLGAERVERCVTSKIRRWAFPKPQGGGTVVVNYPFVFKNAG